MILIIANFSTFICIADMSVGVVTQNITSNNSTKHVDLAFANDSQSYTTGGITFNYPNDLFTQSPFIQVSIKPNSPHSTTETFTAEISSCTASSTTIIIYNISAGIVSEAATNSVTVYLFALADPTGSF
jgi:hypothetical protein